MGESCYLSNTFTDKNWCNKDQWLDLDLKVKKDSNRLQETKID